MVLGDEEPEYGEGVEGCGMGRFWTFTSALCSRLVGLSRERGGGRKLTFGEFWHLLVPFLEFEGFG